MLFSSIFFYFFINLVFNVFLNNFNLIYLFIAYLNFLFFNTQVVLIILFLLARNSFNMCFLVFCYFSMKSKLIWYNQVGGEQWVSALNYGLNVIHPTLFYISLILLFYLFFFHKYLIRILLIYSLEIISMALLLGMYWGSINAGWGFFWSNDSIEYILVLLTILLLHFQHFMLSKIKVWIRQYFYIMILFILFLIRFNLFFSIHSFFITPNVSSFIFSSYSILLIFNLNNIFYFLFIFFTFLLIVFTIPNFVITEIAEILIKNIFLYYFHVSFYILLYFLILNNYYYGVISYNFNLDVSWVFAKVDLLWDYTKYLYSNNLLQNFYTTLSLYTYIFTNIIFYSSKFYMYIYYMGFYYYVYIYILISLYKIYVR